MKKIGLIILSMACLMAVVLKSNASIYKVMDVLENAIDFETRTHDFGDMNQGEKVSHVFKFTNSEFEPLIITDVKTSCGCTAPSWSRAPLMKGKSGEIKIVFDSAGKSKGFYKEIYVISNQGRDTLEITGNIIVPNKNKN